MEKHPPRNLGLDLVRVTEAAALAAGRWMGRGDRVSADQAASEAMFAALNTLDMDGRVVVGEEKRVGIHSPLDAGQKVGNGYGPAVDVVVDPVDGTTLLTQGRSGAISVVGVAPAGSMWSPDPAVYMDKIIVDRRVAGGLVAECMDAPAAWTLALIARLKQKTVEDIVVFMLDRPRHQELIEEIRAAGARVWLRAAGDIAGAMLAATPQSGVDVLMGAGGVPEGVVAACAVKALDGAMLGRLAPQTAEEKTDIQAAGLDAVQILTVDQLITSQEIFFAATGVTNGPLLRGVRYFGDHAKTHSIILRTETGTRREINSEHSMKRLFTMNSG
ncbi:MAG TPA: class II fructose-bisphosphatase [Chloroflexi bacterium]|nr:MAG: fructose-bisphosphatase class II [Anaerolineaceae bacterium 4572_5.2]HEY84310.1 class II fructose-bisphosphatase [Chloroflexota bacterium]